MNNNCLILVDLQYDFLPGGNLAVPKGDEVIDVANRVIEKFDFVVSTQDWHPPDHGSFASQHPGKKPGEFINLFGLNQVLWPDHCIMNSEGAKFVKNLNLSKVKKIFPKGQDPKVDSYSGFFDNGKKIETGMGEYLKKQGIETIYVLGLALDYCVKFTAIDGQELGFNTYLVEDGCRAVNLQPDDGKKAIEEMKSLGIHVIHSNQI